MFAVMMLTRETMHAIILLHNPHQQHRQHRTTEHIYARIIAKFLSWRRLSQPPRHPRIFYGLTDDYIRNVIVAARFYLCFMFQSFMWPASRRMCNKRIYYISHRPYICRRKRCCRKKTTYSYVIVIKRI